MAVRYLLDTNSVSYVIKGNFPQVRQRLLRVPMSEVGISVITEAELRFRVARLPQAAKLGIVIEEFLRSVEVLVWDSAAAQQYAHLRSVLEKGGEPLGNMDMSIAAHALALGSILVSHDRAFRKVEGLKIEDWTRS
jgi:tRNA(fMet)-specific endonuclease VapC